MGLRHRVGVGVPSGTAPARQADPIDLTRLPVSPMQLLDGSDERSTLSKRHIVTRVVVQPEFLVVRSEPFYCRD